MVRAKVSRVLMVVDAAVGSARIELTPDGKKEEEGKPGDDNLALSRGRGVAA